MQADLQQFQPRIDSFFLPKIWRKMIYFLHNLIF